MRVSKLERKSVDVTAKDVAAFVEQMREMIIESERAAERLDASIQDREAALEDLNDLVENKLDRLNRISAYEETPSIENLALGDNPLQSEVYRLYLQGKSGIEIAKQLKITLKEVNMIINMGKE
jgi:DNA-binding NarL/FixJ family response regulator